MEVVIVRNCQYETYLWVDGALCRPEDLPEVELQRFVRGELHLMQEAMRLVTPRPSFLTTSDRI